MVRSETRHTWRCTCSLVLVSRQCTHLRRRCRSDGGLRECSHLFFQTGTRGTVLGLLAGGGTAALFLAVRGASMPRVRKVASGALILGVLLVGSFVALRDTALVQNSPTLERLTHISLSEGGIRFTNWGMAWEGVKERPLFGWGHESFNYVFNTYYNPAMYGAER